MGNRHWAIWLAGALMVAGAACSTQVAQPPPAPTTTLRPIISLTPRLTATPVPTRTPIPTFTPIPPTPSDTPPPSATPTVTPTPPITGQIYSTQRVNVRMGPGLDFDDFASLDPGAEIVLLGQSQDGRWYNIRLEDGDEGWIAASLVQLLPTITPLPTFTPSPNLTRLANPGGTAFPTAILGGGTVTPTPPRGAVSPTPADDDALGVTDEAAFYATAAAQTATAVSIIPTIVVPENARQGTPIVFTVTPTPTATASREASNLVPVVGTQPTQDDSGVDVAAINQTATALSPVRLTPSATASPVTGATTVPGTARPTTSADAGGAVVQQGTDVLAYCDNPAARQPAPTNLAVGSIIDVYWVWYAATEAQIQDHLSAATYTVTVNGTPLANIPRGRQAVRQADDGNYYVSWIVPYELTARGEVVIDYRVTWSRQIFDGFDYFGPGTNRASETGTCTFTVR